jgi:hypothetical protein
MEPWPALRTLHLPGGLRVEELEEARARLGPIARADKSILVEDYKYRDLGTRTKSLTGLSGLGCEFFTTDDALAGINQSDWRTPLPSQTNVWPTHQAELDWSGLAHAAELAGNAKIHDISGAITSQYRLALMRLLDLSGWYHRNLVSILSRHEERTHDTAYSGYFGDMLHSSIHAAFFEIGALKEYLLEFFALAVLGADFDRMSDVAKHIQKMAHPTDFEREILDATITDGWLLDFSERRNTHAHRTPFARAPGRGMMYLKEQATPSGGSLWLLHMPLADPIGARARRSMPVSNAGRRSGKDIAEGILEARSKADVMEYLFGIFARLVDLGRRLRPYFPLEPKMFTVTDEHIISIDWHESVNSTR